MRPAAGIQGSTDRGLGGVRPAARRPLDLLLAFGGALVMGAFLIVVGVTSDRGEPADPQELRSLVPAWLLALSAGVANVTVIVLVGVTALERLIHREFRQMARALLAGALGYGLTGAVNAVAVALAEPGGLSETLSAAPGRGTFTDPLHAYLAAATAYVGGLSPGHLPRVRLAMWAGIAVTAVSVLLAGVTTSLALVLTLAVGWTCAALASYIVGLARPAPVTGRLARELARFGLDPLAIAPAGTDGEGNPRFVADTTDRRVDVVLLRADDPAGLWKRLLGLVMLRDSAAPPVLLGLHRRLEHMALMYSAARAAGGTGPRLLAIGDLGQGTVILVREHVRVRTLDETDPASLTDDLLRDIWGELGLLHRHRIAHGAINGDTVGLLLGGRPVLTALSGGSIAAAPIRASLDVAAMLSVLAMRVGERRAVDTAVGVLGVEGVAATLPFLQPAGMPLALRRRLRAHPDILGALRARIAGVAPEAPSRPARLERMRPRTVVSVVAATAVGVVLAYQLADVDLSTIGGADLGWASAALAASVLCMVAAAMTLMGFVPVRLGLWRTVLVQYAGSFIRIAAPAGVGLLALNTRYAARSGASAGVAVAAVGLSQVVGLVMHVPLLLVCAYLTGTSYLAEFSPSMTFIVVSATLSVLVAAVLLLPALRRAVLDRVRPYVRGTLPQFLDLAQSPRRLAMGLGGTFLLTAGFVLCLHFSVEAFGGSASVAAVAVVFLAGNAIGSAAPSPGGLGAVEAALLGGLTTVAGVPAAVALPAVLLFRLLTFWLPVLPGWGAFHLLQRWGAI